MYNFIRTIRTFTTPKTGVCIAIGAVLALTILLAGCPQAAPIGDAPTGPANLVVEIGHNQAVLTWDAVSGAVEYRVYRAEAGGPLVRVPTDTAIIDTFFIDNGVINNTVYRYTVRSVDSTGTESGDSAEMRATPMAIAPPAPAKFTATAGHGEVTLSWAVSPGAEEYRIYRADTPNEIRARIPATITDAVYTYTEEGLANGTTYRYTVRGYNERGEGVASAEISATPMAIVLPAPGNFTAVAGNERVTLSWDAVAGATGYQIYRADTANAPLTPLPTGDITGTTYADTGLTNGTTYRYTVRAFIRNNDNSESEGRVSVEVSAVPVLTAPSAPKNLNAIVADKQITLSWNEVADVAEYRIFRAVGTGTLTRINEGTTITTTTYTDTMLTNGTEYRYTVRAVNAAGAGPDSSPISATPIASTVVPGTPARLTVTIGDQSLTLRWDAVPGATQYYVYRRLSTGNLTRIAANETINGTTYTDTGLTAGTPYSYAVSAVNSIGAGSQSTEVTETALAIPAVPTGIGSSVSVAVGVIRAQILWIASDSAAEYRIYRADTPSGDFARIASNETITATTYTDATLVGGTAYRYVIRAVNAAGESAASVETTVTAPTPPAAPANLTAIAASNRITLSWNEVAEATEYRIYRSLTANGSLTRIAGNEMITATTYINIGITNDIEHRYVVRAFNSMGESANSNEVRATPSQPVPAIPANLTATAGDTQVTLSWEAADRATSYNIYRATANGLLTRIARNMTIFEAPYTDTGLANDTTYRYIVRGYNIGGESGASNEVTATPTAPTDPPAAPANVTATATAATVIGESAQVALSWDEVATATEYRIYRAVTGATLARIDDSVTITDTTYTDSTGLVNGTAYRYVIRAVNRHGEGAGSTVTATPTSTATRPTVPANFSGTARLNAGNASVTLTWDAVTGASEYYVYRSDTATGTLTRIATTVRITGTTYTDFLLAGGTSYRYAVRSANVAGESVNSNIATVTAITAIAAPENLSGTVGSAAQVELSWNAVSGATEYRVYRAPNSLYRTLTRVGGSITGTTYTNTGLTRGATYWYVVRAVNAAGESTNSNEIRILVPRVPSAPASLSATSGDTLVSLSWAAVDNATEYRIYRSAASTGSLTLIAGSATTGTAYTNTGLTNSTSYRYAVRAVNAAGESSNSAIVNSTPSSLSSAPTTVAGLTGTPGNAQVTLSWDPVRGASEYRVFRSAVSSGNLVRIDENTTIAATTYTDTGLTNTTTYRYSVRAANSSGPSLESTIISVTPDDHGNSQAAATTLTPGNTVTGNIGPANDVDFFAIPVSTNRFENVLLTATTTGLGGTTGVILGRPRIGIGTQSWQDQNSNNPLDVSTTITETGTYYLRVDGATGNYSLTVTAVAVPAFDDDHGNTGTTATPITSGTAVSGILGAFDRDFFSIEVTGASGANPVTITVATTGTAGASGFIQNELNGGVNELARQNANTSNVSLTSLSITANGVYYIQLSAAAIPTGNYTLTATVQ